MLDVIFQLGMTEAVPCKTEAVPCKTEVLQGTLDLMELRTLESLGPRHGYAISARIEQVSVGVLQLNLGKLYPALMRLDRRGLIRGKVGHEHSQQAPVDLSAHYAAKGFQHWVLRRFGE